MRNNIRELWNSKSSFEFFLEQNINKDLKILEIWCNLWTFMSLLYNEGYYNIVWIDINKSAIIAWKEKYSYISENLKVYNGDILPFNDSEFDVVVSFDVLEHIPNVNKHLQEVKRVLKKWWIYIGQTPNKITNIPWEIINNKSLTKWKTYHCSLQTLKSLKMIFNSNWFDIDIKKRDLENDYNIGKVKRKLWFMGLFLLKIVNKLPLGLQTNFWFISKKYN